MAFANNLFFYYDHTVMPAYIQNRIDAASLVYSRNEFFFPTPFDVVTSDWTWC